jgi:hypothetical protein
LLIHAKRQTMLLTFWLDSHTPVLGEARVAAAAATQN